jgi:hypothetical protein
MAMEVAADKHGTDDRRPVVSRIIAVTVRACRTSDATAEAQAHGRDEPGADPS